MIQTLEKCDGQKGYFQKIMAVLFFSLYYEIISIQQSIYSKEKKSIEKMLFLKVSYLYPSFGHLFIHYLLQL